MKCLSLTVKLINIEVFIIQYKSPRKFFFILDVKLILKKWFHKVTHESFMNDKVKNCTALDIQMYYNDLSPNDLASPSKKKKTVIRVQLYRTIAILLPLRING